MKYTVKDLSEHIVENDVYHIYINIDNHEINLSRDCSYAGSSFGKYFTLRVDGKIISRRIGEYQGFKKAVQVLNAQ